MKSCQPMLLIGAVDSGQQEQDCHDTVECFFKLFATFLQQRLQACDLSCNMPRKPHHPSCHRQCSSQLHLAWSNSAVLQACNYSNDPESTRYLTMCRSVQPTMHNHSMVLCEGQPAFLLPVRQPGLAGPPQGHACSRHSDIQNSSNGQTQPCHCALRAGEGSHQLSFSREEAPGSALVWYVGCRRFGWLLSCCSSSFWLSCSIPSSWLVSGSSCCFRLGRSS